MPKLLPLHTIAKDLNYNPNFYTLREIEKYFPMTKNFILAFFLLGLGLAPAYAQDDAFVTTGISDDLTVDAEQNKAWRMGEAQYSAKPKSAWELGVHLGHYFIDGDVDRQLPGGYGVGLHLRKSLHYVFSLRGDLFYGQAKGLETQTWGTRADGGGLVEYGNAGDPDYVNGYAQYEGTQGWFPSHKTTQVYGALQGVLNIGNLLFHKDRNKWNWYLAVGVGLSNHTTKLDLLNSSGNAYSSTLRNDVGWTAEKFDTKSGRADIKDAIQGIYDGDYETEGFKKQGIFRLGDDTNIHVVWTGSMGISRKINKRINIGIEHQVMLADNDYLDGIKFRTALDQTNNADIPHYTNLRLGINLGNMDKVTEPLYWLNPIDGAMNDIAELKQRPILDLTDEDADGILDMFDQELDTPEGCPVDTRGITLDSDNDGVADCKDQEPYSPPGFDVDSKGVAMVPAPITESDVNDLIDNKTTGILKTVDTKIAAADNGCGEWFLPMIHYDLDKYSIKPEFYGHLHHVANVLKMCPEVCVTAVGHTDVRSGNSYNQVLSYNRAKAAVDYLVNNYGIDRSRFNLMYGGEETPLISGNGSAKHYMNRRVEFRVCQAGDYDMARPEGPNAGTGARSTGAKYSGNKNSGY